MAKKTSDETFTRVQGMRTKDLTELHEEGSCPSLEKCKGIASGKVLGRGLIARLNLWRGKDFTGLNSSGTQISGINRLGICRREFKRFTFVGYIGESLFRPKDVLIISHDEIGNPAWVRSYHDEVVDIGDGILLGRSYIRKRNGLVFAGDFALHFKGA